MMQSIIFRAAILANVALFGLVQAAPQHGQVLQLRQDFPCGSRNDCPGYCADAAYNVDCLNGQCMCIPPAPATQSCSESVRDNNQCFCPNGQVWNKGSCGGGCGSCPA